VRLASCHLPVLVAGALVAGALAAGCRPTVFECEANSDCATGQAAGRCEPIGYCSYRDPECPSAYRYGTQAGDGLAKRCVPVEAESSSGTSASRGSSEG
jgi:hypothetical protein